jgi:hypothetical protein
MILIARLESGFVAWSKLMRKSHWTPSIVPNEHDQTVYLAAEDFGRLGRAWREADYETTDLETVLQDLLSGQYRNPFRVIAFNTADGWSEDSPTNCAVAAICRCAISRPRSLILLSATKAMIGVNWRSDWSDPDSLLPSPNLSRVEFAPCLPTRGIAVPAGPDWIHETSTTATPYRSS